MIAGSDKGLILQSDLQAFYAVGLKKTAIRRTQYRNTYSRQTGKLPGMDQIKHHSQ